MLGVGIDYDIFFVTRIREEVLNGKSDTEAIVTAVDRVWVTILGLGLVLSTVFASLLITGIAILQEISLAVSAAILSRRTCRNPVLCAFTNGTGSAMELVADENKEG